MYSTTSRAAIYPEGKGPVFPKTYSRVVFRIKGESQLRFFDGAKQAKNVVGSGNAQEWCQTFVDMRCRAFLKLDGYNPLTREYKNAEVISHEVDMFYCDHPEVNK